MSGSNRLRAIVTTVPFGAIDAEPIRLLEEAGIDLTINPLGRKLKTEEVADVINGYDIIIAGTEIISREAMAASQPLKIICRVGIGLDGVDLLAARDLGIAVSYTPDGPSPAVAELAVGLMIDCLRDAATSDRTIRAGDWKRPAGKRVARSKIGVIGCGRIGGRVIRHLLFGFPGVEILYHDVRADVDVPNDPNVRRAPLDEIVATCDAITLHVPLTPETRDLFDAKTLRVMKSDAVLINTARGGIVNEDDLADALKARAIRAAAIDTFLLEPYKGPLTDCDNVILTAHLGSMTEDCRLTMEVEAVKEAVRFARAEPLATPVPETEYELARQS